MTADRAGATAAGPRELLTQLFGGYRAEWMGESLFDLFTAPDYLPELTTARPCFLIGGRGTGKTTVLRGLSYPGRRALSSDTDPLTWDYYGSYLRVNTNRVTAFQGPELTEGQWIKIFSHYINLILVGDALQLLGTLEADSGTVIALPVGALENLAASLHLPVASSLGELSASLATSRIRFESYINNVADGTLPQLSMLGQPLDLLFESLAAIPELSGKLFFFLIDEYENFSDYQQDVVNTLIKHSGSVYTFKVGARDLGLRRRATLNEHEQLISPADYERIDITAKLQNGAFSEFAARVCNERLKRLPLRAGSPTDVRALLPGMSESQEALALGVESHIREIRAGLRSAAGDAELLAFDQMSPLEAYLVGFWATAQGDEPLNVLRAALEDRVSWRTRLDNYQHAMLFTIRRRRRGIHKFYCGWDTYTLIANGNIRFLLQLVAECLLRHLDDEEQLGGVIPPDTQTHAAREVGRKNLTELEGLAVNGAQLTRLVLGLGRVFQVMASQAEGHAPETNQFVVQPAVGDMHVRDEGDSPEVADILRAGIMHQALVRSAANKLPGSSGDTKEYDYALHPIFAAFFEYSHRRKRRMVLTPGDVTGLVNKPRQTIEAILRRTKRDPDESLPDQLELFTQYYNAVP